MKCATWPNAWTPASVRLAPWTVSFSCVICCERVVQGALDRRNARLELPAVEIGAIVGDGEFDILHRLSGIISCAREGTTAERS